MTMKASTRQVDGITVVDLSGRITLGEGSVVLRDAVRDLLSAFTTVRNQGGELKLLNLTKKVHDLLQITKLYTVFDVKDDEAAAISSFKK